MARRPKSFEERCQELAGALHIIERAIQDCEQGHGTPPLTAVAIQLRALLIRAGRNRPLLVELARERNFPLTVYATDPGYLDRITKIAGSPPIFYSTVDMLSLEQNPMFPVETTLAEALKLRYVTILDKELSLERVIRLVANTEAAHYDPERPVELDSLDVVGLGGLPAHYRTVYHLGRITRDLGRQFIEATA